MAALLEKSQRVMVELRDEEEMQLHYGGEPNGPKIRTVMSAKI